jgi:RNA polymerase sigma-70 factor (sigma-E family)
VVDAETRRQVTDFVTARSGALIRYAYVLTCDQSAAEDLLQTALTRTAARWRHVRGDPEAYVRKAMYHEQLNRWRNRRNRPETVLAEPPDTAVGDRTGEVDVRLEVERALRQLPPRRRAVLVLRYLEDLPESEVARLMGCSVGTVRSQASRAMARLRELAPHLGQLVDVSYGEHGDQEVPR